MNRRDLIKGAAAATALAVTGPIGAQARLTRNAQLFDLARAELNRVGAGIWKHDVVGIADFGLHSAEERFHFVDMQSGGVTSYHVSHGDGSDPEHDGWLKRYSNEEGSHCTSRGAYMTRSWYTGRYGTSIRLDGLDPTNSNALPRAIVMHQADYATPQHVARWGRLGRSNGCLAMGPDQFDAALIELSGGRLVVAGSYGIAVDGSRITPPTPQIDLLVRDRPNAFERANPGVY